MTRLRKLAQAALTRIKRLERTHHRTDPVHRTVSAEQVCKPNHIVRVAGVLTGVMGVALLAPIPFLVGAGVEESGLVERVLVNPQIGLLYGLAPFGGIAAAHGLREAVSNDRIRRFVDLGIYTGAIAVSYTHLTLPTIA